MDTHEPCPKCDGMMEQRACNATFTFPHQTLTFENVEVWVCLLCGEQYWDAAVAERIAALGAGPASGSEDTP